MCVSYGISLCVCEIRIYLFGLFTFAKIPDNNISTGLECMEINCFCMLMQVFNIILLKICISYHNTKVCPCVHALHRSEYCKEYFKGHSTTVIGFILLMKRGLLLRSFPRPAYKEMES